MKKAARNSVGNGGAGGAPSVPIPPATVVPDTIKAESEERHRRISDAAYYRAERRGFAPGHEDEDWLEAEKELSLGEARSDGMALEDKDISDSK